MQQVAGKAHAPLVGWTKTMNTCPLFPDPGTRSALVLLIGVAEAVTGNKET